MNLDEFDRLDSPCQNIREWQAYLELCEAHLRNRGVVAPLVVEIGTFRMKQRPYYLQLLNAEHISIDVATNKAAPDIVGDSRDKATYDALIDRLAGRRPDIVFIDGDHSYPAVKSDWEMYGTLAKHIVAFHDCDSLGEDVGRLWHELRTTGGADSHRTFVLICENRGFPPHMGIGLVVKDIGTR